MTKRKAPKSKAKASSKKKSRTKAKSKAKSKSKTKTKTRAGVKKKRKTTAKKKRKTTAKKKSRSKRKRSSKKKKSKRSFGLWKLFLIVMIVGGAAAFTTWVHVDSRVQEFLVRKDVSQDSAIYSDELRLFPSKELTFAKLKDMLAKRGYKTSATAKPKPGEYIFGEDLIRLKTREFRTPAGKIRTPKAVSISFSDEEGNAKVSFNSNEEIVDQFYFEPIVLSNFGSADMRAAHYLPLSEIPKLLQAAVVLTEDQRFMQHYGIDIIGISRAMVENIKAGSVVQGGSTITQQLAKNLFFSSRKTFARKYFEAFAALSLEQRISKAEILERYLNEVYLGQEGSIALHGMAEASRAFFRKELNELSISQMALLAGVIKAPSYYSPRNKPKRAKERRNVVLKLMLDAQVISNKQYKRALKSPLHVIKDALHTKVAPHFLAALRRHVSDNINLDAVHSAGGALFTSINPEIQRCAEESIQKGLTTLEETYPALKRKTRLESGLVAIEPYSGKVRAWVGSRNFVKNQFDHVDQGKRQVGSTIKPFLYISAIDPGIHTPEPFTPLTTLKDEPISISANGQSWEPQNYDKKYRGSVTLRYALENSLNLAAVYTASKVGFNKLADVARRFELSDKILDVPSLSLGAIDTTLLRMTTAYAGIANGGILTSPRMFISILDPDGALLHSSNIEEKYVADPAPTFVVTNLMRGVIERGTGNVIRRKGFKFPVAGKTGTSNETRDTWFLGFTPEMAVGVWVGFDDNVKVGLTGSSAAAPIWADFMICSAPFLRGLDFVPPPGVAFAKIDSLTNLRVGPNCQGRGDVVDEIFIKGTEPDWLCNNREVQRVQTISATRAIPDVEPEVESTNPLETENSKNSAQTSNSELLPNVEFTSPANE